MPIRPEPDIDAWAQTWREAAEKVSAGGEALTSWLGNGLDAVGHLRYGMSTAEKERAASGRTLPGAPVDRSAGQEVANRYAAGYLFGQEHPTLAPMVQPAVDAIKTSWLPFVGGDSPDLQVEAQRGIDRALQGPGPTPGSLADLGYGRR